jgi:hypothetical protein
MEGDSVQVAFSMNRQVRLGRIMDRSQGHNLPETVRFSGLDDDVFARVSFIAIAWSPPLPIERRQDFLLAHDSHHTVGFVNPQSNIAFDYFGITSTPD